MTDQSLTLSDMIFILRKKKGLLFAAALLFGLIGFLIALFCSTPLFQAQASFHQGQSQMEEGSLQSMLKSLSFGSQSIPAKAVMQSRRVLNDVVTASGLQIVPVDRHRFRTVVLTEFHISQEMPDLFFQNVFYEKNRPTTLFIVPLSDTSFEVLDPAKKSLGTGILHEPFDFKEGRFTLAHMSHLRAPLKCKVISKRQACDHVRKKLKIKGARGDSNLVYLSFSHPFRQTAIATLNSVMEIFQNYLKQEHDEVATAQVRYLHKRLEQMGRDYDQALQQHVAYLEETMGIDGFLGLAQEIEMLSEPREKYMAQKHELDLAQKRWQEPQGFVAHADHPWKQGRQKIEELLWEKEQLGALTPEDDLSGLDLETAHTLHTEYTKELDTTTTEITRLSSASDALAASHFEISALSQFLNDQVSQSLIQKGTEMALALADRENRTSKELARLEESLRIQKRFLREHIEQKMALLKTRSQLIYEKLHSLKQKALALIEKEKGHTEEKLSEIVLKMKDLPEKWRLESRLKLKKELILQIIEGLTQLSESKVLKRHLYHVASKPLDFADAPFNLRSPHLFLSAAFAALLGAFVTFFVLSVNSEKRDNFPLSCQTK